MIFVQRHGATGTVAFSGSRARVLRDGQVVVDWTIGGSIEVPQGAGYTLEVQNSAGVTSQGLSVGIVVSALGQSNMEHWFTQGTGALASAATSVLQPDGTRVPVSGTAAAIFSRILADATGVPVLMVNSAVNGTPLLPGDDTGNGHWLSTDPGSLYETALSQVQSVGGNPDFVLWSQGEADRGSSELSYQAGLATFLTTLGLDFGHPSVLIQDLGVLDPAITAAQQAVAALLGNVAIGDSTAQADRFDGVHLDGASLAESATRMAYVALAQLGYTNLFSTMTAGAGGSTLNGSSGVDFLIGQGAADTLNGAQGNDLVLGGDGNDRLYGGIDDDILRGQTGDDQLYGQTGNDVLGGGSGNDLMSGGAGNDELWGDDGDDQVSGDAGNDLIMGNGGNDHLLGGDGNDMLDGGDGIDVVDGGAGDDTLRALFGGDQLLGGDGNDTIWIAGIPALVDGGTGIDTLQITKHVVFAAGSLKNIEIIEVFQDSLADFSALLDPINAQSLGIAGSIVTMIGGGGSDQLTGRESDDHLSGNAGNDVLLGGQGADVLAGGAGDDTINGGGGFDTATYADASAGVSVDLSVTTAQNTIGAGVDTLTGIEALVGSAFGDTLSGGTGDDILTGGYGADILSGGAGNDQLSGGDGNDTASYASAGGAVTVFLPRTTAQDTIGAGVDTLSGIENVTGSAFADTLVGNLGDNILTGGAGNDLLVGGKGDDWLNGAAGYDTASYSDADGAVAVNLSITGRQNTLNRGMDILTGIESLIGSAFNDRLTGNAFTNTLEGGSGNDWLDGGAGVDEASYAGARAAVQVSLSLTGAQDTGGAGIDTLINIENLTGSQFNDRLRGNADSNRLDGGSGADELDGGLGLDVLVGGLGADRFDFTSTLGGSNIDRIVDFTVSNDKLYLSRTIFSALTIGPIAASALKIGSAATDADDRIIYNPNTGALSYDADGAGGAAAIVFANIGIGQQLTAANIAVF